jgi:hypothetical protein
MDTDRDSPTTKGDLRDSFARRDQHYSALLQEIDFDHSAILAAMVEMQRELMLAFESLRPAAGPPSCQR